jgi:2-dehydro-3-deoxyphosphogluconate aldolase/(4S)-4-hydroxy-2-oxoglutarate aldolase
MAKDDVLRRIREVRLFAVLRGPSPEIAMEMVKALVAGGVQGIEITYSTPNAAQVVRELDRIYGENLLLGMGTLTEPQHAEAAKQAGARYIVSPHGEEALAAAMQATGLAVMIGALTPSEIKWALRHGSDIVKLFPGSLVGPGYVRSLRGPYPDLPLMPTGGVSVENVAEWFSAGVVAVGAGSELCPSAWAQAGQFAEITQRAQEFVHAVRAARVSA